MYCFSMHRCRCGSSLDRWWRLSQGYLLLMVQPLSYHLGVEYVVQYVFDGAGALKAVVNGKCPIDGDRPNWRRICGASCIYYLCDVIRYCVVGNCTCTLAQCSHRKCVILSCTSAEVVQWQYGGLVDCRVATRANYWRLLHVDTLMGIIANINR